MTEQQRYDAFIAGLTTLSRMYGIAFNGIDCSNGKNCLIFADEADEYKNLRYYTDENDGSLWAVATQ